MFTKHVIVRIFDFMKVVFIQLSNETCEIGMLEHARQNRLGELVHILKKRHGQRGTIRDKEEIHIL